jgi:hypothetical protein
VAVTSRSIPPFCGVAFKEWAGICAALLDGRQSLILRKGGIDEEDGEFRPEHPAFWLYPTHLHEKQQGLRDERSPDLGHPPPGMLDLPGLVSVEGVIWVDRLEQLDTLTDLHVWTAETIEKRFHYRKPGLWVLGVEVFRADRPRRIVVTPEQAGCRSWVPLEEPPSTEGLVPTLDESTLSGRMDRIRSLSARGAS